MSAKMSKTHVPDQETLSALGEIALRHEHMNNILIMTIKSLTEVSPQEAVKAHARATSAELRRRVRRLAKSRLGDGPALIKLEAVLADCERLTRQRNDLVHCLWAETHEGEAYLRDAYGITRSAPTADELKQLASEIERHADQLNQDRRSGWLSNAMKENPAKK